LEGPALRKIQVALIAALAALASGACGGDEGGTPDASEDTTASTSAVPFDQAFIDAMVPHHRRAIAMAKAAKSRGLTVPELSKISDDIVVSQQREIDQMLAWREQWFGSRTLGPVLPEVLGVPETDLGMDHGGAQEILEATDVDTTFADMMIPHHEGAVAMAEAAAEKAQHEDVKDLAQEIVAAQEREISVLEEHAGGGMEH
jgi:uncharacterized protein (DUF305 family)